MIEDYIAHGFHTKGDYSKYAGAKYSDLFDRQRQLPFGQKLQNHALNSRLNEEFRKYFRTLGSLPIIRNSSTSLYWINEDLLKVSIGAKKSVNLAETVIEVIDAYVAAKRDALVQFIADCKKMQQIDTVSQTEIVTFVDGLLHPSVDARTFEIVSYAILKAHYGSRSVFWGWSATELTEEPLMLYKTGRTNANDGGIDFVMRPLGRFFQVTETVDARKYFLDIDKVQRFPITFVVKTHEGLPELREVIRVQAAKRYKIDAIVERYMDCIEELINIPSLLVHLSAAVEAGKLSEILDEIATQSELEFNFEEDADSSTDASGFDVDDPS
ncbi:MAG: restriction endonuclease [Fimbriimonadaceae bacterium]